MEDDFQRVFSYYEEFLRHPEDARKVAWRSVHGQELRFENLLEALDEGVVPFSVLDVGCGLGDLFGYLGRTGRQVDYLGVDIVPQMVEQARARHPEGRFEVCNILESPPRRRFDLVLCSGGMTVRVPRHEQFVRRMLEAMLELADMAVAVNFQSTRAYGLNPLARQDEDLYHADPLKLYGMCRQLSRWTALREDMLVSDVTVYLYKGHSRSLGRYARLPSPAPDPLGLAWLALERRLPAEALRILEGAPKGAARSNFAGVAHHQLGQLKEALALYQEALALEPGFEPARLNLQALRSQAG
jgi:SAM-dependent methyltransferase